MLLVVIGCQNLAAHRDDARMNFFVLLGWFTLATEAESESEALGTLRSSVNQKSESETESEARRNRSQKDQKSFFFFRYRFRFRRFRRLCESALNVSARQHRNQGITNSASFTATSVHLCP